MKNTSHHILVGVLTLFLLSSACAARPGPSPTSVGTILPEGQTQAPTSTSFTATNTPLTPIIPITGENVVEMQCQFCVNELTHAVFIFPDIAIFDVESSSPVTCLTAKVYNGKRVLVCNAMQLTSFNLKICSDSSNCLLFPVALQECPLVPNTGGPLLTSTPSTPIFLTAINTLRAPTSTRSQNASTATPGPSQIPTSTSIQPTATGILPTIPILTTIAPPPVTSVTPMPPPPPTSTQPPPPTSEPSQISEPTSSSTDDHRRDTRTPRPTRPPRP
jgi:hypothetical protein